MVSTVFLSVLAIFLTHESPSYGITIDYQLTLQSESYRTPRLQCQWVNMCACFVVMPGRCWIHNVNSIYRVSTGST